MGAPDRYAKSNGQREKASMTTHEFPFTLSDDEWRKRLSPEQYHVMRQHGTERPGSCALLHEKRAGVFTCAGCDQELFASKLKFESGTGWPSFTQPVNENAVSYVKDTSYGMIRVEVLCNACDAHLGHVFPDGPAPSGLRYCINSVSIRLQEPAG